MNEEEVVDPEHPRYQSLMIRKKIANLSRTAEGGDLFDKKVGKIFTKFWAAGTATVTDFDNYIQKLKEKKDLQKKYKVIELRAGNLKTLKRMFMGKGFVNFM